MKNPKTHSQIQVTDVEIDSTGTIIKDKTITVMGDTLTECKKIYDQLKNR